MRFGTEDWNMINAESPHGQVWNVRSLAASQLILFSQKQFIISEESYEPQENCRICWCSTSSPQDNNSGAARALSEPEMVARAESALVLEPRNSRRVGSWQGKKGRNKEDLEKNSISNTDGGSPKCTSNKLAFCQNISFSPFPSNKGNSTLKCFVDYEQFGTLHICSNSAVWIKVKVFSLNRSSINHIFNRNLTLSKILYPLSPLAFLK